MKSLLPLVCCLPALLSPALLSPATAEAGEVLDFAYVVDCDADVFEGFVEYEAVYFLYDGEVADFDELEEPRITMGSPRFTRTVRLPGGITQVLPALDESGESTLPTTATRAELSDPADDQPEWLWIEVSGSVLDAGEITFSVVEVGDGEPVPLGAVWTTNVTCEEPDTTPPEVLCAVEVDTLRSRNKKFVDVGLDVLATDDSGAEPTLDLFVFSDEASDATRGKKGPDAILDEEGLHLRGERDGAGDGRVYLVYVRARDAADNEAFTACTVVVPRDNSRAAIQAVDDEAAAALQETLDTGLPPAGYVRVD